MGRCRRPHRALCRRGFGYWRYRCHQYSTHYGDRHARKPCGETARGRCAAARLSSFHDPERKSQSATTREVTLKPRTRPTRKEIGLLRRRLPHWKHRGDVSTILRDLYLLFVYYCGIYYIARQLHRLLWRSRGAIYSYHRVNDYSKDVLTVDTMTFAAQLLAIRSRYPFSSTAHLVDCIRNKKPVQPTTITIQFDDCYRIF